MFKRIIVAIDGSHTSSRALRAAINLAKEQQARLLIAHAMDVVAFYSDMPYDLDMYEQSVRKAGERILKRARAAAEKAGVQAETQLLEVQEIADRVADEIERAAKRWKADLLVIGTHGRRGVRRLLLGSVAESLVRISSMPVLLIRGQ